jgi:hypothetical protein
MVGKIGNKAQSLHCLDRGGVWEQIEMTERSIWRQGDIDDYN